MPKRNRTRTMKGGVDMSFFTNSWNSLSKGASDAWAKTKQAATSVYQPPAPAPSVTVPAPSVPALAPAPVQPMNTTPSLGGRRRKMRGGFTDNTPVTGIASTASPISDIKSAQPHHWVGGKHHLVGGKTKRHRKYKNKHSKSYKKGHTRRHHRK